MKNLIKNRVSVVVPVYNTAPAYLEQCFASIRNQTYEETELLIVNDGSVNEETNRFCREYADKNQDRCVLVQTKNQGVSMARREGIMRASGAMLMFVDSDDSLEQGAVARLKEVMESQEADAVIGEDYVRDHVEPMIVYAEREILSALLENREASFGWALWGKLFDTKRMKNTYRPRRDIYYGEDLLAAAEYFAEAKKAVLINEKVYFYRTDNPDSAMKQAKSVKKLTLIRMWRELAKIYQVRGMDAEADRIMANYYDSLLSGYLQCEYYRYDDYKRIMKDIKGELKRSMRDIMANRYVAGKYKYTAALHFLWLFKLKRRITGRENE